MKHLRLHTKFIIVLTTVALVPLAIVSVAALVRFQQTLAADADKLGNQLAATAAAEIKTFMVSQMRILDNVAVLYHPQFPIEPEVAERLLENILFSSENFMDISVLNPEGREIARKNRILVIRPGDLRQLSDTPQFKTVKEQGIYVGPMYVNSGRPLFDFGRSIVDSQGAFAGAVFAQVDARIMPTVVENISRISGGRIYIVNEKGIVIAHPDLSYVLSEHDLSHLPPVGTIVATGKAESAIYENETGERVLGSAYPMNFELFDARLPDAAHINWFIIAEQMEDIVFQDAREAAWYFGLISIGALILAAGTAVFFAGRISKPVELLHMASIHFGRGNLSYRANVKTGDEIEDLAQSFNVMAETLTKNIESLKKEEEVISAERNKLRLILSGITNAVVAVDLDRRIILFNKAAETLTGLNTSKVLGKLLEEVISIYDGEQKIPLDMYCPREGFSDGPLFAKNDLQMKDTLGKEHFVNVVSGGIREGLSIQLGCIITFQDITREFLMERTKQEFVTIAAHQLRTPLTGMKWSIDYLFSEEKGRLAAAQKELVAQARNAVDRMIVLVNDLLDVSSIEEGRFGVKLVRQSIDPIINQVVNLFERAAVKKGVTLIVGKSDALPTIDVDSEKIEIVLNNILDNAIHYTPVGGEVRLRTSIDNSKIVISIADTGIGIPTGDTERIFTKFFRSPTAQAHNTDGSGLGLYVAKNIMDQHNGTLTFESKQNVGTTFYISFPVPKAENRYTHAVPADALKRG